MKKDEMDRLYWEEIRLEQREKKAIKKGLKQGIEQNNILIIKNMLNNNININTISKITNKSIDSINEIKKETN